MANEPGSQENLQVNRSLTAWEKRKRSKARRLIFVKAGNADGESAVDVETLATRLGMSADHGMGDNLRCPFGIALVRVDRAPSAYCGPAE